VVRIQEAATREADARGWDLDMVKGMVQEVDGSTCDLLRDADRVLQELAEEARASWEERAAYYNAHVTNLAGETFKLGTRGDGPGETAWSTRMSWTGR
jgi:hypothetical protein